jgi:hypothetical protein
MTQVRKHIAERFIDWFPMNTKLYIRGEVGKPWEIRAILYKELFGRLKEFFDKEWPSEPADVQRYSTHIAAHPSGVEVQMLPNPAGDWVRFADVASSKESCAGSGSEATLEDGGRGVCARYSDKD